MVRVLIICSMVMAIASCRGDKKSYKTVNLSNGETQVEVISDSSKKSEASNPDETPIQKAIKEDDKQKAEREELKKQEEIVAAVKQLKLMLDASITAANPMRVAGIVISNKTADIPLREKVSDALLFKTLEQVPNNPSFSEILEMAGRQLSIKFDSKARIVSTGSDQATIKAVSLLVTSTEPEKIRAAARIPFAIELSADFFKSEPSIDSKEFDAVLALDQDGRYSHFNLHDKISRKEVGKIILPLTDSKQVKDQKMIVQFFEERGPDTRIERVIPLQLQLVNFIK